jgi:hypothetical protein
MSYSLDYDDLSVDSFDPEQDPVPSSGTVDHQILEFSDGLSECGAICETEDYTGCGCSPF